LPFNIQLRHANVTGTTAATINAVKGRLRALVAPEGCADGRLREMLGAQFILLFSRACTWSTDVQSKIRLMSFMIMCVLASSHLWQWHSLPNKWLRS
jgi:hypothetical protein